VRRISLALVAISLIAAACTGDTPDRDASGQIVEPSDASVFDLEVGDCFDDPTGAGQVIFEVPVVPCDDPHDNEVYHQYEMTESDFPGGDDVLETSTGRCLDRFQGFVGIAYQESELALSPITPTAESWAEGDRVVYCVLYSVDLSKLTGTMRNSGR
jgi:hypothetical protein